MLVSRPKELPLLEGEHGMTPSEYHEIMSQPANSELFNRQDWTLGRPTHPSPKSLLLQP